MRESARASVYRARFLFPNIAALQAILLRENYISISFRYPLKPLQYDSAEMYGGFQGGPQLVPPDAERRQSLGQLEVSVTVFLSGSLSTLRKLCFHFL